MGLDHLARRHNPDGKINKVPQTPAEHMAQMREKSDAPLNQKLAQWETIRTNQESGRGARVDDDVLNLELLFKGINDDRKRLGLEALDSQGDLL